MAMIKKSSAFTMNTKKNSSPSRRYSASVRSAGGLIKFLLSVNIMVGKEQKIPAKTVCVHNKKNKKDWIAFI